MLAFVLEIIATIVIKLIGVSILIGLIMILFLMMKFIFRKPKPFSVHFDINVQTKTETKYSQDFTPVQTE